MAEWIDRNERKPEPDGTVWAWHEGCVQEVNAAWVAGPYSMARYWMPIPWPMPPLGLSPHPKQTPAGVAEEAKGYARGLREGSRNAKLAVVGAAAKLIDEFASVIDASGVAVTSQAQEQR